MYKIDNLMILVHRIAPLPPTSNVGGSKTYYAIKFEPRHNQHRSVGGGGRGGTIILLYG